MGKNTEIAKTKFRIQDVEQELHKEDTPIQQHLEMIIRRRVQVAKLFTLHGYARHTGNGDVLRISSLPDNLHILFDGHTVPQPIGWYEPATEQEYQDYLTKQNTGV